jgi:hypothetical protein
MRSDRHCARTGPGRRLARAVGTPMMAPAAGSSRSRSRAIWRITASCCQSFSPNSATIGANLVEQLAHHGGHAIEMAGSGRAAQSRADPATPRIGGKACRIHHVHRLAPTIRLTPSASSSRLVSGQLAWIGVQILVRAELAWVDEDRHGDMRSAFAGFGAPASDGLHAARPSSAPAPAAPSAFSAETARAVDQVARNEFAPANPLG